jgi:hypothetical protein
MNTQRSKDPRKRKATEKIASTNVSLRTACLYLLLKRLLICYTNDTVEYRSSTHNRMFTAAISIVN